MKWINVPSFFFVMFSFHLHRAQEGDSNIKMPGCVCFVFENRPILNETLSCKTHPYCHKLVYFKEDLTRNIMCLYSSEIRQLSYT